MAMDAKAKYDEACEAERSVRAALAAAEKAAAELSVQHKQACVRVNEAARALAESVGLPTGEYDRALDYLRMSGGCSAP